jgi:hypothetical protein
MTITAQDDKKDFASESGHWYGKNGEPKYSIIGKNGKERSTTLRDAREYGLVPSVTTILKMEAAPALERWKIQQACLACMTLPRIADESDDTFMARALKDSQEQARKAAERGTYLHGLLEDSVRHGRLPVKATAEDEIIIRPVLTWLEVNFNGYSWSPERSFAHDRFGGKIDLHGDASSGDESATIDYKFKDGIEPTKRLAYDNHSTQMAAYAYGLGKPKSRCINLFIDSRKPGLIVPVEWTQADIDTGWQCFSHLLSLWYLRKGL